MTRPWLLVVALVALGAALLPPMHDLAHDSFAWHMVQHLALIFVVAPAAAFGAPQLAKLRPIARPLLIVVLHALAVWGWHLPELYDAALEQPALHALEHASFLVTGFLFWGVVGERFGPVDALKRAGVVFAVGIQSAALGALLVFASEPLYDFHLSSDLGGRTPLEDQQLAGGLMWVPPGIVYLVVTLALLLRWMQGSERTSTEGMS